MATVRSASPLLGVNTADIFSVGDAGYTQVPLGAITIATNGRKYLFVQASANIATGDSTPVAVIVTETGTPAPTVATGAGAFSHRGIAVTSTQRFWVEANAL